MIKFYKIKLVQEYVNIKYKTKAKDSDYKFLIDSII